MSTTVKNTPRVPQPLNGSGTYVPASRSAPQRPKLGRVCKKFDSPCSNALRTFGKSLGRMLNGCSAFYIFRVIGQSTRDMAMAPARHDT